MLLRTTVSVVSSLTSTNAGSGDSENSTGATGDGVVKSNVSLPPPPPSDGGFVTLRTWLPGSSSGAVNRMRLPVCTSASMRLVVNKDLAVRNESGPVDADTVSGLDVTGVGTEVGNVRHGIGHRQHGKVERAR